MAKLVYTMTASLDGHIEDRAGSFGFSVPDDEVHAHANRLTMDTSAFVFGRRLYEAMEQPWRDAAARDDVPAVEAEFARIYLSIPRYVVSDTLDEAPDGVTIVRRDDAPATVARLKESLDGDLGVGGPALAAALVDLVDEVRVHVMPVVLGGGTPFLPVEAQADLRLLEHRAFDSGVVYLRYARRRDE